METPLADPTSPQKISLNVDPFNIETLGLWKMCFLSARIMQNAGLLQSEACGKPLFSQSELCGKHAFRQPKTCGSMVLC